MSAPSTSRVPSRIAGAARAREAAPLVGASVLAAAGFAWPLVTPALPTDARSAVPVVALALLPALVVVVALVVDRAVPTASTIALLGVLAAVGAAIRIAGTGVGGVEAVFIVLILAGRAYGARFGFLLGMLTIALSSLLWGGVGPWTPFQMFASAWVAAGAGLLPRRLPGGARVAARVEVAILALYGVAAAYAFGLVMNLWFWPFAVGAGAEISYEPGAPVGQNLAAFGLYSLVTSTLTWDTVRAVTTAIGIAVIGRGALAALRRSPLARRVEPRTPHARTPEPAVSGGAQTEK